MNSIEQRFFNLVEKIPFHTCWEWMGATHNGYGKFKLDIKTAKWAHRISYELAKGPIPEGLHIDHLCRNRACVNPEHLEAVTQTENNRRGIGFGGLNFKKTHCPNGHEYNDRNTDHLKSGRRCRTCHREESARRYHRNKISHI